MTYTDDTIETDDYIEYDTGLATWADDGYILVVRIDK